MGALPSRCGSPTCGIHLTGAPCVRDERLPARHGAGQGLRRVGHSCSRARRACARRLGRMMRLRDIDLFGGDFKGGKAGSSSSNGFMVFTAVEDSVACCIKCVTYQHPANEPACVAWSYDTKSQRCWPKIAQVEVPLPRPGYISMDMHLKFRRTRAPTKWPSAPRSATPTVLPTTKTPTLFPSFDYQYGPATSATACCSQRQVRSLGRRYHPPRFSGGTPLCPPCSRRSRRRSRRPESPYRQRHRKHRRRRT